MDEGTVLRVIGGFFRVLLDDGRTVETKPRGRLRREGATIVAGDRVQVVAPADGIGVIEGVLPRRIALQRPSVANVDQMAAVMALAEPAPNYALLDRLLVGAAFSGLDPLVVWNKADLVSPEQARREMDVYENAGYRVVAASARTGEGVEPLAEALRGRITTLAGPSGVGKSALLNALNPLWERAEGEVSDRLGLGRHTTRAVELLPLKDGGLVADTPGFSTFDLRDVPAAELRRLWPELVRESSACRFPGCLHGTEPDCAVREAVQEGRIHRRRYDNYVHMLKELEDWEARKYS